MPWFVEEFREFLLQVIDEISDFYQWPINKILNFFWTTTVEIRNFFLEIRHSFSQPIDGVLNVERTDGFCEFFSTITRRKFRLFSCTIEGTHDFYTSDIDKTLNLFYCIRLMKMATSVTDWRNFCNFFCCNFFWDWLAKFGIFPNDLLTKFANLFYDQ